ncbi:hypothetical protein [Burkholderia ubonensis]|uniref:hypothetical protein n=1 Tax=Burkholderia ubonensis TaxID=101571 RepID=UPI0012F96A09|nr:hypothetical protein [Burkholderia ubonensis]
MKNGKVLTINNVASNRDGRGTNVGGNLIASGFGLNHSFAITLQDGTSYRVKAPQNSYYDDHINPGNKIIDGTPSLKLRYGKYAFNNPAVSKIVVDEKPLHIPASLHPVTYELEGAALLTTSIPATAQRSDCRPPELMRSNPMRPPGTCTSRRSMMWMSLGMRHSMNLNCV